MIRVSITLADATVTETETLTAGRVGLECAFTFSGDWDGLQKVAVFEGAETVEVALGTATVAVVPPECMATAGYNLRVGAYGLSQEEAVVIPTIWAKAGKIKDSAAPDDESFAPATPELVAQIMESSQTALTLAQEVAQAAANGDFNGADGVSPTASVSKVGTTATITITDANGTTTATVSDGADGAPGQDGTNGTDGVGVVAGGTTGQLLAKKTATDYDTEWVDAPTEVFWAIYGTTTASDIGSAVSAGKFVALKYEDTWGIPHYGFLSLVGLDYYFFGYDYSTNKVEEYKCASNDSWSFTTVLVPSASTSYPADLAAAAAVGTGTTYARADHKHKLPSASDVGAIAAPVSPSDGDFLVYDSGTSSWVATAVPAANGEDF